MNRPFIASGQFWLGAASMLAGLCLFIAAGGWWLS
jgi:hypothetical protein